MHHSTSRRAPAAAAPTGQVNDNDNIKVNVPAVKDLSRSAGVTGGHDKRQWSNARQSRCAFYCSSTLGSLLLGNVQGAHDRWRMPSTHNTSFGRRVNWKPAGPAGCGEGTADVRRGGGARRAVRGADQSG
jgi:hypothetical protein